MCHFLKNGRDFVMEDIPHQPLERVSCTCTGIGIRLPNQGGGSSSSAAVG